MFKNELDNQYCLNTSTMIDQIAKTGRSQSSVVIYTFFSVLLLAFSLTAENSAMAQYFLIPDGYKVETTYKELGNGSTLRGTKITPKKGQFSYLSSIIMLPISETSLDPTKWLEDHMTLNIGVNRILKDLVVDPDNPFIKQENRKLHNLIENSLVKLSQFQKWPLDFCKPISVVTNPAGSGEELVCQYPIGPMTQYLVVRVQKVNNLWYRTTIRTMNKKRLRHFLAITNSFYVR